MRLSLRSIPKQARSSEALYGLWTSEIGDGEEATIAWMRMSGPPARPMGAAIMSEGDELALTIEEGSHEATQRPFLLFSAASANLCRRSLHHVAASLACPGIGKDQVTAPLINGPGFEDR